MLVKIHTYLSILPLTFEDDVEAILFEDRNISIGDVDF